LWGYFEGLLKRSETTAASILPERGDAVTEDYGSVLMFYYLRFF